MPKTLKGTGNPFKNKRHHQSRNEDAEGGGLMPQKMLFVQNNTLTNSLEEDTTFISQTAFHPTPSG